MKTIKSILSLSAVAFMLSACSGCCSDPCNPCPRPVCAPKPCAPKPCCPAPCAPVCAPACGTNSCAR